MVPKKIDGKAPSSNSGTGGVKLTYRHYLQDRKFAAVLELPDDLAGKFSAALASPVYSLFLGRKCCVPTDVVGRGTFTTETEAFEEILAIAAAKKVVPAKRIVEVPPGTAGAETFYDLPVRFGGHKVYRDRTVRIDPWPAEQP